MGGECRGRSGSSAVQQLILEAPESLDELAVVVLRAPGTYKKSKGG